MPMELKTQQHELLPTTATKLIDIDYQIEACVQHESTFGSSQEVPSLFFPLIAARNPEGPLDLGTEGMVVTQMQREQEFYAS